jgi:hypothetical protein
MAMTRSPNLILGIEPGICLGRPVKPGNDDAGRWLNLFGPSSYIAMMRQCKIVAPANAEPAAKALILSPPG